MTQRTKRCLNDIDILFNHPQHLMFENKFCFLTFTNKRKDIDVERTLVNAVEI